jgi:hypothetical protein
MNTANGVNLMARRCAAMCSLMVGCADRSPGLRSYRRARGFTCTVPGDAAHIAPNPSSDWGIAAPDELRHPLTISRRAGVAGLDEPEAGSFVEAKGRPQYAERPSGIKIYSQ